MERHREHTEETKLRGEALPPGVLEATVIKEEQQECSSSVDQQEPEPPLHIKEEQEELWSSQEGEQLQGLEETITKFPFTVPVKSEDDEEEAQSSQLHQRQTQHMKTEADGEERKTFSCSECGKRFGLKGNLKIHIITHTGEKPFRCTVCKKSFTQRANLQSHMRTHTREKPFSCCECGKAFSNRGNLKNHMRTHTGEKPFSCSVCNKSFTVRESLRSHMAVHTGEKRFSCSVCNKRFAWRSDVKTHKCVGQMETEADGEDCGGPESARNSHPHPLLQPETEDQTGDSSEPETDDMK